MPRARRDLIVKLPKPSHLLCRYPLLGHDHEVAVTLKVAAPEREPADQVGAEEVLPENRVDAGHQFCQQLIQRRKDRRRGSRSLFSRHHSIQTASRYSGSGYAIDLGFLEL